MRELSSGKLAAKRLEGVVLPTAVLSLISLLWLPAIRSSLWLDELGTYWVIKDGWSETLHRGYEFHGQPAYYLFAWSIKHIFGASESGLRLPSMLAAIAAVYLVFRVGKRLWDRQTGLLAAVVFAASRDVAFVAIDARPYALLYLVAAGSTLTLIRWLDEGKRRDAFVYVLLAATIVHLQAAAAPVLLAHAAYVVRRTSVTPSRRRPLVMMALGVCLLQMPGVFSFVWFITRSEMLSIGGPPQINLLLKFLLVPTIILVGAALLRGIRRARTRGAENEAPGALTLSASLMLFPPFTLLFISFWPSVRIFLPRYFGVAAIGVALVVAWAIRQLDPPVLRVALAVALSVASIAVAGVPTEHLDMDWRAAAAFERSTADDGTALLVQAGFVEGTEVSWLIDKERSDYLLAPISFYRFEGEVTPLPQRLDAPARDYLERITRLTLARRRDFIIITNEPDFLTLWFADRTRALGMKLERYRRFGTLSVAHFRAIRVT